ncbi:MAG: sulfurtransferase TusA family protein [Nitrososphaerota archaeon]
MVQNIKPNRTLDCIGLYCPEPVLGTRMELDRMAVNEVLEVLADDPSAEEDIKSLVKRTGHALLNIEKEDNILRFIIRKIVRG